MKGISGISEKAEEQLGETGLKLEWPLGLFGCNNTGKQQPPHEPITKAGTAYEEDTAGRE